MIEKKNICNVIHEDSIKGILKDIPKEETFYDLAEVFKVFGDTTRIKILYSLFKQEMCVCDIAILLGTTHSAVSHQLRILKQAKLVKFRKQGKVVYYSLADKHVKSIFNEGLEHVEEV